MNALMVARLLRPSYGWQLASKAGAYLPQRMLVVNDAKQLERLRALPAYQAALLRHQYDAEACLSRVLIRTGKRLEQLRGEDLLFYADVVRTSGRNRREHLAWELLVALGPFAGEPVTLRAAWSAKGNTRQHSVETLVDRYGVPAGGVRDLLVDYLRELKPSMDYGSLEGWAYRLVRLFWWEVLERRRATRPGGELRTATGEEWAEFENHFLLRKVALGDCHRPYGTPCVHEHACVKCRFLRVDPAQRHRIEEMTSNAEARLAEAKDRAWLGEVAALEESLIHLRQRCSDAEQQRRARTAGFTSC
jgi:hypothetical protein